MRKRTAMLLVLALTMTAFLTSPASADTRTFHDADDSPSVADIFWVQVKNSRRVIVTVQIDDFYEAPPGSPPEPDTLKVWFDTRRRDPGPEFRLVSSQDTVLYRVERWGQRGNPIVARCGVRSATRNDQSDRWRAVIARPCLGRPGSVRVGVRTEFRRDADWAPEPQRFYGWVRR